MAYIDALFDGSTILNGVEARLVADLQAVRACWASGEAIPLVTVPEDLLVSQFRFDAAVDATLRRNRILPDLREYATVSVGLGPGYIPGQNCHIAIETQWGPSMGDVLLDRPAADRAGGPRALAGVGRERFVSAPVAGQWRTTASIGQAVRANEIVGRVGGLMLFAPIDGHLRGIAHDGVEVVAGQWIVEVDPREQPDVFGLGERPQAIASGVLKALGWGAGRELGLARGQ
jgi:xanthine dehydrogenase accessory factor